MQFPERFFPKMERNKLLEFLPKSLKSGPKKEIEALYYPN